MFEDVTLSDDNIYATLSHEQPGPSAPLRTRKLKGLTNYSKYLTSTVVHNAITVIVTEDYKITCCGVFLALASEKLETFLKINDVLDVRALDVGHGDIKAGIEDCLKLLYGGRIAVNIDNFGILMKFSVHYDINLIYELCKDWVFEQTQPTVVLEVVKMVLSDKDIQTYESGEPSTSKQASICWSRQWCFRSELLVKCRKILIESINAVVSLLNMEDLDENMVSFLFGIDTIDALTMILKNWVQTSEASCRVVLNCIEDFFRANVDNENTVVLHAESLNSLFNAMNSTASDISLKTKIAELQNLLMRNIMNQVVKVVDFSPRKRFDFAEFKLWRTYTLQQLIKSRSDYELSAHNFAEVAFDWLNNTWTSQHTVQQLCNEIDVKSLPRDLYTVLRNTISRKYPEVAPDAHIDSYDYKIFESRDRFEIDKIIDGKWTTLHHGLTENVRFRLLTDRNPETASFYEVQGTYNRKLHLACYMMCTMRDVKANPFLELFNKKVVKRYMSLLTNSSAHIKQILRSTINITIVLAYET